VIFRAYLRASALTLISMVCLTVATSFASNAIYTTDKTGTEVNQNIYGLASDVYLSGGPQNQHHSGLADGTYFFQVTDPSGKVLLSTDNAVCRQLQVVNGAVAGAVGPCPHQNGIFNPANGALPVQLAPYSATPNQGLEYKAWLIAQTASTSISKTDPRVINFKQKDSDTDNFKVQSGTVAQGSCQPSGSLSTLVSGTNVVAYVPKGSWSFNGVFLGIGVTNVEGSSVTPTLVPTPSTVNSCASNAASGQTVCTANTADVYLLNGTSLSSTLTSGATGTVGFSGGICANCGVTIDATHNKALLSVSVGGAPGFQFLNLGTSSFETAFASPSGMISEAVLLDPIHNMLMSAAENNNYEAVNVSNSLVPSFFENPIPGVAGEFDSSGEDCSTGISLAGVEFARPSQVLVADMTQGTFTPGSPGSWSAAYQLQNLSESVLFSGATGVAVAPGTHTGLLATEFGGTNLTAIALPVSSGSGTPAIADWVSCTVGGGFAYGRDPHPINAYQSPNSGHAIGVLANNNATMLAVIDLSQMLDTTVVPRTAGGHGCAAGTLPAGVVSFISVP
jgi:hypothetical protein